MFVSCLAKLASTDAHNQLLCESSKLLRLMLITKCQESGALTAKIQSKIILGVPSINRYSLFPFFPLIDILVQIGEALQTLAKDVPKVSIIDIFFPCLLCKSHQFICVNDIDYLLFLVKANK